MEIEKWYESERCGVIFGSSEPAPPLHLPSLCFSKQPRCHPHVELCNGVPAAELRRSWGPYSCVSAQAAAVGNYTAGERKCKECNSLFLSAILSLSLFLCLCFSFPQTRNNKVHASCSHGRCNFTCTLTVCDVHFFLKSKEHDLFSLLFLSDLIGHSSHIHEWHL